MSSQEGEVIQQKIEKILLELNKTGLSYLKYMKFAEAIDFFKKAEKIVCEELIIESNDQKMNQLAGVTFNNLACYYKKTKKPKVALGYLKKSLELEVYKINDWVSTASTHLNICAIYSSIHKHQEALGHVNLAVSLLAKVNYDIDAKTDQARTYWNIKMLSFFNKAIEEEHLKIHQNALASYQQAKAIAQISGAKNVGIIAQCNQAISRIETLMSTLKTKIMNIFLKKKQNQEAGHYDAMRKYKKYHSLKKSNDVSYTGEAQRFSLYKNVSFKGIGQTTQKSFQKLIKIQKGTKHGNFKNVGEYLAGRNKTEANEQRFLSANDKNEDERYVATSFSKG